MPYNTGFPMSYPQYPQQYPQQYQQPISTPQQQIQQQQPVQQGSLIWVSGEAGAKAYLVAPNTTVQLWDSGENVVYIKSADSSGMPSMKILDYTIRDSGSQRSDSQENENFATKKELRALEEKITKLIGGTSGA